MMSFSVEVKVHAHITVQEKIQIKPPPINFFHTPINKTAQIQIPLYFRGFETQSNSKKYSFVLQYFIIRSSVNRSLKRFATSIRKYLSRPKIN